MIEPSSRTPIQPNATSDRAVALVIAPVLLLALVLLTILAIKRYFDPDEIESLRAGWQILRGRAIYSEFFEHHHPLFYLTLSVPLALFPERPLTILWIRELNLGLIGIMLVATFWLGRRLFGVGAGLAALVLLTTTHIAIQKMIELRPDNLQSVLGLLGMVLLIDCFDRPRAWTALASGAMFGLSFVALQKAVFLLLPVAAIVGLRLLHRRFRWRDVVLMGAGFVAALLPFVAWLAAAGSLHDFVLLNYGLNARQIYVAGPGETLRRDPQVMRVLANSASLSSALWAFALAAGFSALRPAIGADPGRVRLRREFCIIAAVLVLWVVITNKFYWQYYLPAFPFLAILAGGALVEALRQHRVVLASVLLIACVDPLWTIQDVIGGAKGNGWQIGAFEKAMALTRPDDKVIDTLLRYNVYRPDPLYMGFINADGLVPLALFRVTGRTENVLEVVAASQPVLVDLEALPRGAWPGDPRLAGYSLLPSMLSMGEVLIRSDRLPAAP